MYPCVRVLKFDWLCLPLLISSKAWEVSNFLGWEIWRSFIRRHICGQVLLRCNAGVQRTHVSIQLSTLCSRIARDKGTCSSLTAIYSVLALHTIIPSESMPDLIIVLSNSLKCFSRSSFLCAAVLSAASIFARSCLYQSLFQLNHRRRQLHCI